MASDNDCGLMRVVFALSICRFSNTFFPNMVYDLKQLTFIKRTFQRDIPKNGREGDYAGRGWKKLLEVFYGFYAVKA